MYNHARYIQQCLDSVYNEDYPNIELIIIDDGSNDESVEVAKKWRESHQGKFHRFHIETQENRGICKTLNKLISLAQGEYIIPLASDDYLLPGNVQLRINALKNHPDWLAVFCDTIVVDEHNKLLSDSGIEFNGGRKKILSNQNFMKREMILNWTLPGPVILARKDTYNPTIGIGLYDENLYHEDVDFYYRLLARNALGFIDSKVAAYRLIKTSMCHDEKRKNKLRKHWRESCIKNINQFRGINKLYLQLLLHRLTLNIKYFEEKSLSNYLKKIMLVIISKLIYCIHTTHFYLTHLM
jgi:glycosyltransferase involved in cell wall biosynthesis